jgi:hypothetical protein
VQLLAQRREVVAVDRVVLVAVAVAVVEQVPVAAVVIAVAAVAELLASLVSLNRRFSNWPA